MAVKPAFAALCAAAMVVLAVLFAARHRLPAEELSGGLSSSAQVPDTHGARVTRVSGASERAAPEPVGRRFARDAGGGHSSAANDGYGETKPPLPLPVEVGGQVLTPEGAPAVWARVALVGRGTDGTGLVTTSSQVVSDAQGRFTVSVRTPEAVHLTASAPGYRPSRPAPAVQRQPREREPLILRLRSSHYLAGTVRDTEGNAAAGTTVTATGWESGDDSRRSAVTDAAGHYRMDELSEQEHYIGLSSTRFGDEAGGETKVDRSDADFVIGMGSQKLFLGMVVDWKTGEGVRDFSVTSTGGEKAVIEKLPDEPGMFRVAHMPRNGVKFRIEAPGYATHETDNVLMHPNKQADTAIFQIGQAAVVTGQVIDAVSRKPLPGIEVVIPVNHRFPGGEGNRHASGRTDGRGRFRLEWGRQGHMQVVAIPEYPQVSELRYVELEYGKETDAGNLEVLAGATLRGTINGAGEQKQFRLSSNSRSRAVEVASDGRFEAGGIFPGDVAVYLDSCNLTALVSLGPGDDRNITIDVGSAELAGTILRDGNPCRAEVVLSGQRNGLEIHYNKYSNSGDGSFRIHALSEGIWNVQVTTEPEATLSETLAIFPGERLNRTFNVVTRPAAQP